MDNPSLKIEPRYQPAPILPTSGDASILDWLESTGRLIDRDANEVDLNEGEEFEAILGNDDNDFTEDDDDDDFELEE
jgi:hypothetical protein